MTGHSRWPVELPLERRRCSSASSTGLDYTGYREVDEDIRSRIRALLLARNDRYPPRTPFPSDEHHQRFSIEDDDKARQTETSTFDGIVLGRRESAHNPTSQDPEHYRAWTDGSAMEVEIRRPSQLQLAPSNRSKLRSASSANDLDGLLDDAKIHATELSCCPPCPPEEESKKGFRLPKLVLKEKKKQDMTVIKTCANDNLLAIFGNQTRISSRGRPKEARRSVSDTTSKPLITIEDESVQAAGQIQAQPADIACFLAGCSPGPGDCVKHQRRSSVPPSIPPALKDSLASREEAKGKLTSESRHSSIMKSRPRSRRTSRRPSEVVGIILDPPKSLTVSSASSDAFPHAMQSKEIAGLESIPHTLSSSIVTNFSLPGPKASNIETDRKSRPRDPTQQLRSIKESLSRETLGKDSLDTAPPPKQIPVVLEGIGDPLLKQPERSLQRSPEQPSAVADVTMSETQDNPGEEHQSIEPLRPTQSITSLRSLMPTDEHRRKPSESSVKSKPKTASLLSGASRSSARHPLLKPSISAFSPVDTGLPMPPVLTPHTAEVGQRSGLSSPPTPINRDLGGHSMKRGISKNSADDIRTEAATEDKVPQDNNKAKIKTNDTATAAPLDSFFYNDKYQEDSSSATSNAQNLPPAARDEALDRPSRTRDHLINLHKAREIVSSVEKKIREASEALDAEIVYHRDSPDADKAESKERAIEPPPRASARSRVASRVSVDESMGGPNQDKAPLQIELETAKQPLESEPPSVQGSQPIKTPRDGSIITPGNVNESLSTSSPEVQGARSFIPSKTAPQITGVRDLMSPQFRSRSTTMQQHAKAEDKNAENSPKPRSGSRILSPSVDDSLDARYWGFVPLVKEAVQDAVQVAVRQAVDEIVSPNGDLARQLLLTGDKKTASSPSRSPVPLSKGPATISPSGTVGSLNSVIITPGAGQSRNADPIKNAASPLEGDHGRQSKNFREVGKSSGNPLNTGNLENIAPPSRNASPDNMETIPLKPVEENVSESPKQGWKISGSYKKRPSAYTSIPTRKSSRHHVLKPNSATANSSVKVSPSASQRKRSFERQPSLLGRKLRSISSLGSMKISASVPKPKETKASPLSERSKATLDATRRKSTVHWLQELLSSSGPYEPRLTEIPPRIQRGNDTLAGRNRSMTAPAKPVEELYLGAISRPVDQDDLNQSSKPIQPAAETANFTKTINDLECLLNEALFIARQAAEKEESSLVPATTGMKAALLRDGKSFLDFRRKPGRGGAYVKAADIERSDQVSRGNQGFNKYQRVRTYTGSSSENLVSDHEETFDDDNGTAKALEKSPLASQKSVDVSKITIEKPQNSAGWPPTGRTATPHPPGSTVPSQQGSISASLTVLEASSDSSTGSVRRQDYASANNHPGELGQTAVETDRGKSGAEDAETQNSLSAVPTGVPDIDPFAFQTTVNRRESLMRSPMERSRATTGAAGRNRAPTVVPPRSRANTGRRSQQTASNYQENAANIKGQGTAGRSDRLPLPPVTPGASISRPSAHPMSSDLEMIKSRVPTDSVPNKRQVRQYIEVFHHPPIQPRASSLNLRKQAEKEQKQSHAAATGRTYSWQDVDAKGMGYQSGNEREYKSTADEARFAAQSFAVPLHGDHSLEGSHPSDALDFEVGYGHRQHSVDGAGDAGTRTGVELQDNPDSNLPQKQISQRRGQRASPHIFSLKGKHHVSLRGEHHKGFSFSRSHKRQAIARDWSPGRKRFVASVACISTALVGLLVGIYAAEVPAIQYYIVDFHHYTILGNVFFFLGLAVSTFLFWPLPLLHGRKPYILGSMSIAMPLLFPQALAVGQFRSPYVSYWRIGLLLPRALMGFVLGFANMNFKSTLTDLFGASLQSANPHQEVVDPNDVRRHGGGLGVWLGIWTWCTIGSIGAGFMIGAAIINSNPPAWGFYISIIIIAIVLFLNVLCPEVRRSAFRRSVAEAKTDEGISRRLARGEVKMHMVQSGPKWWGQELHYGVMLSLSMIRQPGFLLVACYVAWIYGQIVLVIVLHGSLMSKYYLFKSPEVGACVMAVPIGAALAIPFQKAGLFSRDRTHAERSDDDTRDKKAGWSSHLVRRAIFVLCLPFAGLAYTLSSNGPPIPFILPVIFAALIGFLSSLAMAECHGIIMETFDTSDLQPGMTGRPRGNSGDKSAHKRTNYSSFPRVMSGFAITQGLGYCIAAISTGVGGVAERHLGQQAATGIMAGILLVLSLGLLGVLVRFREVQIIPDSKKEAMDRWNQARRMSAFNRGEEYDENETRPVIIGNPTHLNRRMCILELGSMTRWSEIRRKNHLVDQNSLEAKHPNLAVMRDVEHRIKEKERELMHHARQSVSRHSSRRSQKSDPEFQDGYSMAPQRPEQGDLGGHREMLSPSAGGSGNGRGGRAARRKTTIQE